MKGQCEPPPQKPHSHQVYCAERKSSINSVQATAVYLVRHHASPQHLVASGYRGLLRILVLRSCAGNGIVASPRVFICCCGCPSYSLLDSTVQDVAIHRVLFAKYQHRIPVFPALQDAFIGEIRAVGCKCCTFIKFIASEQESSAVATVLMQAMFNRPATMLRSQLRSSWVGSM